MGTNSKPALDADTGEPTNAQRARRVQEALQRNPDWSEVASEDSASFDHYTVASLLADVRHFCDAHGLSYFDADRIARDHYAQEKHDELRAR